MKKKKKILEVTVKMLVSKAGLHMATKMFALDQDQDWGWSWGLIKFL